MQSARFRLVLGLVVASAAMSVAPITTAQRSTSSPTLDDPRDPLLNAGPKQVAIGDKVMVSTQHPEGTLAAVKVLRDGGNAVDAAISATFLQNVIDYHQVQLFGAMTGIYYDAKTRTFHAFNAYAERPLSDRGQHGDPMKVSVAGKVKALEQLHKRFGSKPWAGRFILRSTWPSAVC
jgi:gamma-glutamyltranspeptidase / glutathione hydrolase